MIGSSWSITRLCLVPTRSCWCVRGCCSTPNTLVVLFTILFAHINLFRDLCSQKCTARRWSWLIAIWWSLGLISFLELHRKALPPCLLLVIRTGMWPLPAL